MKNTLAYGISVFIGLIFSIFVWQRLLISIIFFGKKALAGPKFRSRPKILTDGKYGRQGYLHLKSITMHYVENGDPSKPLLLLIHGFPEFWFSWRHQLCSDLTNYFRVVAVDLRGYGDSDKPAGAEHYQLEYIVDDLKEAVTALGYSSCYMVGHDCGGVAAWTLAMRHPQLVKRLAVLNCPHPRASRRHLRTSWEQLFKSWHLFFFQLPLMPEWVISRQDLAPIEEALIGKSQGVRRGMISSEELEAYKFNLSEWEALSGPINYYRAELRHPTHGQYKPSVLQPVLLLFGSRDKIVSEEAARLSARFCCGQFDMRSIPEAGHWLQQDAPDLVNQLLLEFFT